MYKFPQILRVKRAGQRGTQSHAVSSVDVIDSICVREAWFRPYTDQFSGTTLYQTDHHNRGKSKMDFVV